MKITHALASLFFLLLLSFNTYSCDQGGDDGENSCSANSSPIPGSTQQSSKPTASVGNPISVITGNKYQREIDYEGAGGIASLLFKRHYNSLNTETDTGLGIGWRHSFDIRLVADIKEGVIQINQSDGRRILFKLDSTNSKLYRAESPQDGLISALGNKILWSLNDGRSIVFMGSRPIEITYPGKRSFILEYEQKKEGYLSKVTDHYGRTLRFTYTSGNTAFGSFNEDKQTTVNLSGHLKSLTLPNGEIINYSYDDDHNLSTVTYPDNTSRVYHYENFGFPNHLTGITNRSGSRFATWDYTDEGRANLSTHANGTEKVTLSYQIPSHAGEIGSTIVTNSLGQKSTYLWKFYPRISQSLLITSEGPGCTTCPAPNKNYTYNNQYQLKTATDTQTGVVTEYDYDKQGRTVSITQKVPSRGATETILEHSDDSPKGEVLISKTKEPHKSGVVSFNSTIDETRLISRYEYEGNLPRPVLIARPSVNPDGEHITKIKYNDDLLPISLTEKGFSPTADNDFESLERTTTLDYTNGNLTTIDGPRADVQDLINLTYDQQNRLKSVTQANGQTLSVLEYDINGQPTQIQQGQQSPLILAYDNRAQISSIKQRQRKIKYDYDIESRLNKITSANGEVINMNYDEAGRLNVLNDNKGRRIEQLHDSESRLIQTQQMGSSGSVLNTISYLYDAQGRLDKTQIQNLDGETETDYQYDEKGQLVKVAKDDSLLGQSVDLSYNNLGQLLGMTQPGEVVTQFSYDNKGQNTALTDARDNKTQTLKDDFGRITQHISPDTGVNTYTYDTAGNRITRIDPENNETRYHWNANNQLIQKQSTDGLTTYSYDSATGKLATTTNPATTETFHYNTEAQLIEHTREIDTHRFTTKYEYNELAKLHKKHLPDGQTLRYHYYTNNNSKQKGKLKAITRETLFGMKQETIIAEIDNDITDGKSSFLSHNGFKNEYTFREDGQLQNIQIADTLKLQYSYDQNGNIIGINENGTLQSYDYSQSRLTFADTLTGHYWYQYDSLGNRTQKIHSTTKGNVLNNTYQYPEESRGNRLTASYMDNMHELEDKSKQYNYNKNGNPLDNDEFSYEYNSDQRPIKIFRTKDGINLLLAEYAYNPFGERIKKIVYSGKETTTTYFHYDLRRLSSKADEKGKISANYLYLNRKPVAKFVHDKTYAIHTDHRGAPRLMTKDDKKIVWQANYSPFGETEIKIQTVQLQLRLPGQYQDNETGTHYNYLRDYNPETGRYITSDPLGISAGMNTYSYVKNDPMNRVDPLGLYDELVHYYMTYFLAVTSGIPEDQAREIALATQFIDDNSPTSPLSGSGIANGALGTYHFTLDYDTGHHGDSSNNILTRFINPSSAQLTNLYDAAMEYDINACMLTTGQSARNTKRQLYGEYMHAFEDSFAHRDRNNLPYDLWNINGENDPNGGVGHALAGHSPDHTFNQLTITDPHYTQPGANPTWGDAWAYNELRTLQMEKEVFESFQRDFATEISANPANRNITWNDLAGDGDATIGVNGGTCPSCWTNGSTPQFDPATGVTGVLQEYNAYNESLPGHSAEKKVDILSDWLESNGYSRIPIYNEDVARQNRQDNLRNLPENENLILETESN